MKDDAKLQAIQIVEEMNAGYQNQTKPALKRSIRVGPSIVHTFGFRGENGRWYENYVVERNARLRGFQSTDEVIQDVSAAFSWHSISTDNLRYFALILITIMMVAALIFSVIYDKISAEVLVGLIGAALGYIAGKSDTLKI